jgi:rubrerythrin
MKQLIKHNRAKVIDLLAGRLAFERAGVRLYDAVIAKLRALRDPGLLLVLGQLQDYRDEEKEHEEWLATQIRELGGDTSVETDMVRLETRESRGIGDVILDGDNDVMHLFHALYAAELADNASWDLLLALADEAGDRDAKKAFKRRLREEDKHLGFARQVVERLARRSVLGEDVEMPTHP